MVIFAKLVNGLHKFMLFCLHKKRNTMRIAVNTRFLIKDKLEGIGWFTYETMRRITNNHPEHQFYFLFDRKPDPHFIFSQNITPIVLSPQARHPFLWYIWFEISVQRFLKRSNIDLFVSPDGYIPLRIKIPSLSVIHDINFHHYPKGIPLLTRYYYKYFFPRFAKKATEIVTVSEYSKNDICKSFNIPPSKITVAYNGANLTYTPVTPSEMQNCRNEITNGKPYFVFVGALNPRKNVPRLIDAFNLFLKESGLDFYMVIVGEPMFLNKGIKNALTRLEDQSRVVFTGRLQVKKLREVLGSACALTYIPYFEGFGIPLVEAMRCHIPIIASNKTSIPEVVADAAFLVDPFNIPSIANAMQQVATSKELQQTLSAKSAERKDYFSWDKTAEILYQAMHKIIKTLS